MTWMEYGKYSNMKNMYNSWSHPTITSKPDSSAGKKQQPLNEGKDASLNTPETSAGEKEQPSKKTSYDLVDGTTSWPTTPPSQVGQKPQYLRRTLDQFYYPALEDTSDRDKDQTISKWTGTPLKQNGRDKAATDSAMIMVDQFWCWIIDESLSSVLLTLPLIAD
jgi:hypothetical protein